MTERDYDAMWSAIAASGLGNHYLLETVTLARTVIRLVAEIEDRTRKSCSAGGGND